MTAPHDDLAARVAAAGGSPCQQDPELWFGTAAEQEIAADRCLDCPAFLACRDYLTAHPEPFGTWAGITEASRRRPVGRPRKETTP